MSDRGVEHRTLANAMRPHHRMVRSHRGALRIVGRLVCDREDMESGLAARIVFERIPLVANGPLPHLRQSLGDWTLRVLDLDRPCLLRRVAGELRPDERLGIPCPIVLRITTGAMSADERPAVFHPRLECG